MHKVFHVNVVRAFGYFVYPEDGAGFILMEYVDGLEIRDYVEQYPEQIDSIFQQAIDGFAHLESRGILHRDIRWGNIMVANNGVVKIIDLGFGKAIEMHHDFNNSVTFLNWCFDAPAEFAQKRYDFTTEVYFVGKMFEILVKDLNIESFSFRSVVSEMTVSDPLKRIASFEAVAAAARNNQFAEIEFSDHELETYRVFASEAIGPLVHIVAGSKNKSDIKKLIGSLEEIWMKYGLEEDFGEIEVVINALITGPYRYYSKRRMTVDVLKRFLSFLKNCPSEKQRMVLSNLHTRLDAVPRAPVEDEDDEIPF